MANSVMENTKLGKNMLKIAICDDDKLLCSELSSYLLKELQAIGGCMIEECYTGEQLVYEYERKKMYDIIILDIEMPLINGLEAGKRIKALDENVEIIILTSHVKYALIGYELHPYRYLMKPACKEKLLEICINIQEKKRQACSGYLDIEIPGSFLHISYSAIRFIESEGKKVHVNISNRVISIYKKLSEVLPLLDSRFAQVHESFIINMEHIEDINFSDGNIYIQECDKPLPISRRRKKDTMVSLKQYIYGNSEAT